MKISLLSYYLCLKVFYRAEIFQGHTVSGIMSLLIQTDIRTAEQTSVSIENSNKEGGREKWKREGKRERRWGRDRSGWRGGGNVSTYIFTSFFLWCWDWTDDLPCSWEANTVYPSNTDNSDCYYFDLKKNKFRKSTILTVYIVFTMSGPYQLFLLYLHFVIIWEVSELFTQLQNKNLVCQSVLNERRRPGFQHTEDLITQDFRQWKLHVYISFAFYPLCF